METKLLPHAKFMLAGILVNLLIAGFLVTNMLPQKTTAEYVTQLFMCFMIPGFGLLFGSPFLAVMRPKGDTRIVAFINGTMVPVIIAIVAMFIVFFLMILANMVTAVSH